MEGTLHKHTLGYSKGLGYNRTVTRWTGQQGYFSGHTSWEAKPVQSHNTIAHLPLFFDWQDDTAAAILEKERRESDRVMELADAKGSERERRVPAWEHSFASCC